MATTHDPRSSDSGSASRSGPRRLRWTLAQYDRLGELGFFRNRRVELIDGEIIERSAVKPLHSIAVELLDDLLRVVFGPGHRFRIQQPLDIGRRTQPAPDAVVLLGQPRDTPDHPRNALLVIEVSDTSLRYDRTVKTHLYAQAGIPEYWKINLVDRQLEIRRNPTRDPSRLGRFTYADVTIVAADGQVSPLAAPAARIAVADLLP
jgi:Uma2 family endonuclease